MKTNKLEIPPVFQYFGKLPTGLWFGIGIGCIKQGNKPPRYISLNIPDPNYAATRPIPGNSMDALVPEQHDEEAKSPAKAQNEPIEMEDSAVGNVDARSLLHQRMRVTMTKMITTQQKTAGFALHAWLLLVCHAMRMHCVTEA